MKTKIVSIAIIFCLFPFAVCQVRNERKKGLEKLRDGPKELCEAIETGNIKAVKTIIKKGIDVNLPAKKDEFPLFYAAGCGRPEIARLLIQAGANVNIEDSCGDTALHIAIREGNYVVAEILINSGVDVNAKIQKGFFPGFRPLHTAVNGKKDIPHLVSLLISKGAEINSRDAKGKTPLQYATMNRFHQSEQILLKYEKDSGSIQKNTHFPALKGPYLGQKPPGMTPELFAPGIITTDKSEGCSGWGNDMEYFIFQRWIEGKSKLYIMNQNNGIWSAPELLPFVDKYQVGDFTIAPDGKTMVFASNVLIDEIGSEGEGGNIWIVVKTETGWTEPKHIGLGINTKYHDSYPCLTANGNLYFFSRRPGGYGDSDLYMSEFVGGEYQAPVNLGPKLNTEYHEWDTFTAPDECYMIYCSTMPAGLGEDDLYVTFKTVDGSWSEPVNMGNEINTEKSENRPYVTPDGKYFFYTSTIRGNRDIYWVDARIIEGLKPPETLR
jgi:hypothetical protein